MFYFRLGPIVHIQNKLPFIKENNDMIISKAQPKMREGRCSCSSLLLFLDMKHLKGQIHNET